MNVPVLTPDPTDTPKDAAGRMVRHQLDIMFWREQQDQDGDVYELLNDTADRVVDALIRLGWTAPAPPPGWVPPDPDQPAGLRLVR